MTVCWAWSHHITLFIIVIEKSRRGREVDSWRATLRILSTFQKYSPHSRSTLHIPEVFSLLIEEAALYYLFATPTNLDKNQSQLFVTCGVGSELGLAFLFSLFIASSKKWINLASFNMVEDDEETTRTVATTVTGISRSSIVSSEAALDELNSILSTSSSTEATPRSWQQPPASVNTSSVAPRASATTTTRPAAATASSNRVPSFVLHNSLTRRVDVSMLSSTIAEDEVDHRHDDQEESDNVQEEE